MITDAHKQAISRSWKLAVPVADTVADLFYKKLFELQPEYRSLFPADITRQKSKLLQMLGFVVKSLDFPDAAWRETADAEEDLFLVVLALGRRHTDLYGVPDESYATVGEALIWTLDYGLGEAFTPEVRAAWVHVYSLLAMAMKMGASAVDPPDSSYRVARNNRRNTAERSA